MTMSKMTLLGVVVAASALIGSGTLAWVRHGRPIAEGRNAVEYVSGPEGRVIGGATDHAIRRQWEREGLPE
jgi:hypothetical protein